MTIDRRATNLFILLLGCFLALPPFANAADTSAAKSLPLPPWSDVPSVETAGQMEGLLERRRGKAKENNREAATAASGWSI